MESMDVNGVYSILILTIINLNSGINQHVASTLYRFHLLIMIYALFVFVHLLLDEFF